MNRTCLWRVALVTGALALFFGPSAVLRGQALVASDTDESLRLKIEGREGKASHALRALHRQFYTYGPALRMTHSAPLVPGVQTDGTAVLVDVVASRHPGSLHQQLRMLGLREGAVAGRVISGWFPISMLGYLDQLELLQSANASIRLSQSGASVSQGDRALYADVARARYRLSGSGVKVGVISDSFDRNGTQRLAAIQAREIPADTEILLDYAHGTDEGRAMAEIVHDVAPGAAIRFHTGFLGMSSMANAIRTLRDVGCKVIVDDLLYLHEPMFADGIIAQAVDEVVASGAVYVSAAGNFRRNAYESVFRPSKKAGLNGKVQHDFDPGSIDKPRLNFVLGNGIAYFLLQWHDPYGSLNDPNDPPRGARTDLDLVVYNEWDGTTYSGLGAFANNVGKDPIEVLVIENWGMARKVSVAVQWQAGATPPPFRLLWIGPLMWDSHLNTGSPTLIGHMNAAGAIAVGAAYYAQTPVFGQNPPLLESFSSAGGTPILFTASGEPTYDLRLKPDIVAPDGVNTSFFGGSDPEGDGLPNFFGTSAAAPHAAAVAALALQRVPRATPAQIRAAFQRTAIDMDEPGFDWGSGFGFLQADKAIGKLLCDVNGDGCVDMMDLWLVFRATQSNALNPRFDLNGDFRINAADLDMIMAHFDNFGSPCPR